MPIEFRCSQCGTLMRTADDTAGKQAKCPTCGLIQPIPAARTSGAPPTSPAVGPLSANPYFDNAALQPPPRQVPFDENPYSSPASLSTQFEAFEQYPLSSGRRRGPPWEREGASFATFVSTAKEMYGSVNFFFAEMRREGGLRAPLVYSLAGGMVGLVATLCYQCGFQAIPLIVLPRAGAGNGAHEMGEFAVGALVLLIFMPIGFILQAFLLSGIFHLALMLFGGARFPYETTFRVVTYSSGATSLLLLIPFCGQWISFITHLVFTGIGLCWAHEISGGKAAGAVVVPFIACCGGLGIGGFLLYFALQ